ncbi:MAG: hypothetical protein PVG30_07335 [Gammaproteobacteria bacterium]|jgi:hypothetical protein
MNQTKTNTNDMQNILDLIDAIEKKDLEKENQLLDEISSPYTIGKCPEPKRWKNTGLQHKLL